MAKEIEVRWGGELPAAAPEVWDAVTVDTAGWLWAIEYEPRLGGADAAASELDWSARLDGVFASEAVR